MFEMRLGLALGKSVGEIRSLPYPEYKKWYLFYLLEPWGWHNEEYLTAKISSTIHNTFSSKNSQRISPEKMMRNMEKSIMKYIKEEIRKSEIIGRKSEMSREEIIKLAKAEWGVRD